MGGPALRVDWLRITLLYDGLLQHLPSPVTRLHSATLSVTCSGLKQCSASSKQWPVTCNPAVHALLEQRLA